MSISAPDDEVTNEGTRYLKTYHNLWQALNSADGKLQVLGQDAVNPADRADARAEDLKVKAMMGNMDEAYYAWLNDGAQVQAPTMAQYTRSIALAEELSHVNAQQTRARTIIALVGEALGIANYLHT
ncbi:hypothetical protein [Undibacterium sp.]|uniref:hypothetical protein n=1 Tax=Undibacterium sp. TaxID=1914977 RepID=UPI0025E5070B|nr:hypothetical protein [Undibacterium sp.]